MLKALCMIVLLFIGFFLLDTGEKASKKKMHIILTGGPGGGKSTLLKALSNRGFTCVDEVAREIIKKQVAVNGEALPWKNCEDFRNKMFEEQIKVLESAPQDDIIFFDRGPIDCLVYSQLIGADIPEEMEHICSGRKFHPLVFVTPPWKKIYENDQERKQTFDEAIETYDQIVATYRAYGYEIIVLPQVDVEKRVQFILQRLDLG